MDENVRIIDRAIAQIRTSLEQSPDPTEGGRQVLALHRKKLDLLEAVLALPFPETHRSPS